MAGFVVSLPIHSAGSCRSRENGNPELNFIINFFEREEKNEEAVYYCAGGCFDVS